jgi:condensin complex subunit 2
MRDFAETFLPDLTVLDGKAISHSLAGFSFAKDAFTMDETTFFRANSHEPDDVDDDHDEGGMGYGDGMGENFQADVDGGQPVEDFFVGDQAVDGDFGGGEVGMGFDGAEGDGTGPVGEDNDASGGLAPFNPHRVPNERDLVMAMTDADGDAGMMDYFDQNFLKNWAGPEHWKLRKVVRKRECRFDILLFALRRA